MPSFVPRVSVIMGVYNAEAFLGDTLRSVVGQSFEDWELIVVDDGSTDGTGKLADQWAGGDPRIRVIHQDNHGRPAPARNRGLREARGEFIAFLDGDDLYHRDRLARAVAMLDALPEVGAVFHEFIRFLSGTEPTDGHAFLAGLDFPASAHWALKPEIIAGEPGWVDTGDFFKFMTVSIVPVHTSAITVRRSVLERIGQPSFDETLPHGEDDHLWIRIARATRMAYSASTLSYYRFHPESWMNAISQRRLDTGAYLVKSDALTHLEHVLSASEWPAYAERVANYWHALGYRCLIGGMIPEARSCFGKSLARTRQPNLVMLNLKGLTVSVLPQSVARSWWRYRKAGEFAPRKVPF